MELDFRFATESDIPLLARMHQMSVEDETGVDPSLREADTDGLCKAKKEIRRLLEKGSQAVVFSVDSAEAGYAMYQTEPEGIFLRHFFVARDRRRQGIGRAAMRRLIEEVWRNPPRIRLGVLVENEAGHGFWKSVGFSDWVIDMKMERATE